MRPAKCVRPGIGAWVAFHLIRGLERALSPEALYRFIAPIVGARVAVLRPRPAMRVPGCVGPQKQLPVARQQRRARYFNTVLQFFPDRLATEKWRQRVQLSGGEYLELARQQKRPVVLAFCHFGPFFLLRYWLRALGIPALTLVRGWSTERPGVKQLQDRVSPFSEIPTALHHEDQLRDMIKLAAAGNPILVAIDVLIGKQINVPMNEDWHFTMATGAIRLAARAGAELIPCSIVDKGRWQFQIKLGPPVPVEMLQSEQIISVGKHLMNALLPEFQKHPEQCAGWFLNLFQQTDIANNASNEFSHSGRVVTG